MQRYNIHKAYQVCLHTGTPVKFVETQGKLLPEALIGVLTIRMSKKQQCLVPLLYLEHHQHQGSNQRFRYNLQSYHEYTVYLIYMGHNILHM